MKTPLFNDHLKLGAKIIPFAGWEMPLQYQGIAPESEAVSKNWESIFSFVCNKICDILRVQKERQKIE